jgi:hypothetical protein
LKSNIGQTCRSKWKIVTFFFFFPFQISLNHLFRNHEVTLLTISYFIFCGTTFSIHVKFPFFLIQMWHVTNFLHLSFQACHTFAQKSHLRPSQLNRQFISHDGLLHNHYLTFLPMKTM